MAAVDDAYAEAVSAVHAMELFDMEAPCVQNFSQQKFDDDGYYSWEGLLTSAGSVAVKAACQRVQTIQDRDWVEADWEGIPERVWAEHGFRRPAEFLSAARKDECRGGCQLGGTPAADRLEDDPPRRGPHDVVNPPRMPVLSGFMPESFPAGYDGAMMGFLTHPQMRDINRMLLGANPLFDHHTMLSRKEDFPGQRWHSHYYHQDDAGASVHIPATRPGGPQLTLVRNLICERSLPPPSHRNCCR